MALARRLSLVMLLLPVMRCASAKAFPVCYYTPEPAETRKTLIVGVKEALATLFTSQLTIADAHDGSLLIARGPAPLLARVTEIWPDLGCVGDARTPADVVKREACREDMKGRVGLPAAAQNPNREGTHYLCRP